jgi:hypothetical protein
MAGLSKINSSFSQQTEYWTYKKVIEFSLKTGVISDVENWVCVCV